MLMIVSCYKFRNEKYQITVRSSAIWIECVVVVCGRDCGNENANIFVDDHVRFVGPAEDVRDGRNRRATHYISRLKTL